MLGQLSGHEAEQRRVVPWAVRHRERLRTAPAPPRPTRLPRRAPPSTRNSGPRANFASNALSRSSNALVIAPSVPQGRALGPGMASRK